MNTWMIGKNSVKHHYQKKKDLCSHLNIEDAGYTHAKTVCRDFEITKLGEYHDLHIQRDRFLLPDVFKNFQNTCLASFY